MIGVPEERVVVTARSKLKVGAAPPLGRGKRGDVRPRNGKRKRIGPPPDNIAPTVSEPKLIK